MPIVFVRDKRTDLARLEPQREVVDGQQRIRTLLTFLEPTLLPDYDKQKDDFTIRPSHNKDLAGMRFTDFPAEIKRRILDYEVSVHILPSSLGDRAVLEIFARMNATGVKLNKQELRNAEYYGEFKTSMYELAAEQLDRWRKWGVFTDRQIARMAEVEFTSELVQSFLQGIVGKSQPALNKIYKLKDDNYPERGAMEERFRHVMDQIHQLLDHDLKRTEYRKRPAFFALACCIYDLTYGLGNNGKVKPRRLPEKLHPKLLSASTKIEKKKAPEKVLIALERRSSHAEERKVVLNFLLKEVASA